MDTRFSSAIHTLILISEAKTPMTSEQIAVSVGTNASYIRKLTALLKNGNIIKSRQGVSGFTLVIAPQELTLYDVYRAIYETNELHIFDIHANPNDECIVGKHITPVLTSAFGAAENAVLQSLKTQTLASVMDNMRNEIEKER